MDSHGSNGRPGGEFERLSLMLGHELKSPLANIKGYIELLEAEHLPEEQARAFLARVRYNTEVMARLISGMIELARIGVRDDPVEEFDFAEAAAESLRLLEGRLAEAGATVTVAEGLPRVRYPRARLVQLLSILLENSLTHGSGRAGLRIAIGHTPGNGRHTFFVSDDGAGITPEEQERIFLPFHSRTKKTLGSSGLGLSIARRIVEVHGGDLTVRSAPGAGATFSFTLPA